MSYSPSAEFSKLRASPTVAIYFSAVNCVCSASIHVVVRGTQNYSTLTSAETASSSGVSNYSALRAGANNIPTLL
jgi:hypothetical protein